MDVNQESGGAARATPAGTGTTDPLPPRSWWIPPFLLLFSFLLRIPSFYPSAIDWDESLYFLMAREFLRGKSLYLSVWDHKPPGLYVLFAWSELVFGQGVLSPRIAACIFVALSGTLLYRFGRDVLASHAVGVVAALLYVAYSVSNVGLAANSEVFFTPFVILGFYLLLVPGGLADGGARLGWPRFLAAGLCLGCSLQVKYVTVFDLAGLLALVLFFGGRRQGPGPRPRPAAIAWVSFGALIPFVPCLLYFWRVGHLADYIYANFTANAIHSRDASFSLVALLRLMGGQIKTNLLPWCAVLLSPLFVSTFRRSAPRSIRDLGILGTWLSFGFLGVVFTRRINLHNFLQILPELCLVGAYVSVQSVSIGAAREKGRRMLLLLLILIPGAFRPLYDSTRASLVPVWAADSAENQKDLPRLLAAYLKGRLDADSYLYVVDTDPILYHLSGARHPTRYIFPPFLLDEHYSRVAGIEPVAELDRIMRLRPRYVVMLDQEAHSRFHSALEEHLRRDYTKETVIEGVALYALVGGPGSPAS